MDRAEQTKQTLTQLYGRSDSPLAGTDRSLPPSRRGSSTVKFTPRRS